jgi:hypothetical protein
MAAPVKTELSPEVRLYACARAAHYLGYWLYPLREADIEEEEEKFEHMLYDVKLFLREAEKYCGVDMSEAEGTWKKRRKPGIGETPWVWGVPRTCLLEL